MSNGLLTVDMKSGLNDIKQQLYEEAKKPENTLKHHFGKDKVIVFVSASDGETRAIVARGVGNTFETAWKQASDLLQKRLASRNVSPIWIKGDLVCQVQSYTYLDFMRYLSTIKTNYFREGISFDSFFNVSFLEQELLSNGMIEQPKNQKQKQLVWKNINFYLKKYQDVKNPVQPESITQVYTFNTIGYFYEANSLHRLHTSGLDINRRVVKDLDGLYVKGLITRCSDFLSDQIDDDGRFRYGYFPCYDKLVPTYNVLRHASTTYSMIEGYRFNPNPYLKERIERALAYLKTHCIEIRQIDNKKECAFMIEREYDSEIKLGANAAAILAFVEYVKVFQDEKYLPLIRLLANGILYFQNLNKGNFVHVLHYADLSVKDAYRIIYYDGEAAFALMRLYGIDPDPKWMSAVTVAFDHFIKEDYWKHSDHWLSYCSLELIEHNPKLEYIVFNLRNASGILDFCLTRETTYPTLLELLMATYKLVKKMKSEEIFMNQLESFDEAKLIQAIHHRATHQLNGFMFPEVAMYFKVPKHILDGFFIRHHSFRVRIDDIEHNLSGYCQYLHEILGYSSMVL